MKLKNLMFVALSAVISIFAISCDNNIAGAGDDLVMSEQISFKINSATSTDFSVNVKLADDAAVSRYVVGLINLDDYIKDNDYISSYILDAIAENGGDASKVDNKYVFSGNAQVDILKGWSPEINTEYVVAIFGVDESGALNSDVLTERVKFLGGAFNVEVLKVGDITCTIKVAKTSELIGNYFVAVGTTEALNGEKFNGDAAAYAQFYIDEVVDYNADFSVVDEMYVFNTNSIIELNESWILTADTEHVVLVFGVDKDGSITSEVATATFKTNAMVMSENKIEIKVTDITPTGAYIITQGSNMDTYYFEVVPTAYFSQYSDSEIVSILISSAGVYLQDLLSKGYDEFSYEGYLEPSTHYTAVAFGTNGGGPTTELFKSADFVTESTDEEPSIIPTDIVVPDVDFGKVVLEPNDKGSLTLKVEPTDKDMEYVAMCGYKEYFDMLTPEETIYDDLTYIESEARKSNVDFYVKLNDYTGKGDYEGTVQGFDSGYICVGYVYGFDRETLQPLTKITKAYCEYPAAKKTRSNANCSLVPSRINFHPFALRRSK